MINIRTARRGAIVIAVGLALAASGISAAVAAPPNPAPTIEWRTGVDGYTTSSVGEYFGGKAFAAQGDASKPSNQIGTVDWRTEVDGYTISFVGEYFGGKGLTAGASPAPEICRDAL